jgi:hypothetical protein
MPDRIRFTLIEDGQDVRPYDFDTETIQIGSDAKRGDNLVINLPQGLRHVRAKVKRSRDYVEMEVKGGPVWLQGSKLEEGDVAELNIGDMLIFGTKKPGGVHLRYEEAKEADIVMDDVADWSVAAAPKPKKGKTAEDDLLFTEEVDEYAGLNPYEKAVKWTRKRYYAFTNWRKKAARIKYWVVLAQGLFAKGKKIVGVALGLLAIGGGYYTQVQGKIKALKEKGVAEERAAQAVLAEKQATEAQNETLEMMRQCGCGGVEVASGGTIAAANEVLTRFGAADETLNPQRQFPMPDKSMKSLADLMSGPFTAAQKDKSVMPAVLERVCSPTKDKQRMDLVQAEVSKYGIHESYAFVPFVESYWCEFAISFTGPRGMMQFTRDTAREAFRQIDVTQADVPSFDFKAHRAWMENRSKQFGGLYGMLARCPEVVKIEYKHQFYEDRTNSQYPNRIDPDDPRTDWEWSTKAAFGWLQRLDQFYRDKGFLELDAILLAMSAYNQGQGMVARWIKAAQERYGVKEEAALSYPQIYGGAMELWIGEADAEQKRRIKEGMDYGPKIMGAYLAAAPQLDARSCR